MINFQNVSKIILPDGEIKSIMDNYGHTLWELILLESLKSTGTQAIDTKVKCSNNMRCEIKFAFSSYPSSGGAYFGAIEYSNGIYLRCHFQTASLGNTQLIGFWQDTPTMGNAVSIPFDTKPHIFTYSAKDYTVGIDNITATHGNNPPINSNFYLFSRNVTGFIANATHPIGKLYYAKFWEKEEMIRYFIPDFDQNNKPCLYDKINHEFYYDLNGGEFEYE